VVPRVCELLEHQYTHVRKRRHLYYVSIVNTMQDGTKDCLAHVFEILSCG